jgi:hypothetical protein
MLRIFHPSIRKWAVSNSRTLKEVPTIILAILFFSALLIFAPVPLNAAQGDVNLFWQRDPAIHMAGYKIHYGIQSGAYSVTIDVGDVYNYSIGGLAPGTYYFSLTSYNSVGLESGYSDERHATINTKDSGAGLLNVVGAPISHAIDTLATVSWNTNAFSTPQIEYGLSTYDWTASSSSDWMFSHTEVLTKLLPGTLYHYRIRSGDADGNLTVSGDFTFKTSMQSTGPVQKTLVFPGPAVLLAGDRLYTGISATNFDSALALLTFRAFDQTGNLISGSGVTNPTYRILDPGEQMAAVETELFGSGSILDSASSMEVSSTAIGIRGISSVFDPSVRMFDGAAGSAIWNSAVFPEVAADLSLPQGRQFNVYFVSNPGSAIENISFNLFGSDRILGSATRTLNAHGALLVNFAELFPGIAPNASSYVRVSSNNPLRVLQLFGNKQDNLAMLDGQDAGSQAKILYSPYYIIGGSWIATVSIINLDSAPDTISIRLIGSDGNQVGQNQSVPIAANGKVFLAPNFFSSGPAIHYGHLEIWSNSARLAGSVVIANSQAHSSSAFPLISNPANSQVLADFVSAQGYYTGLAIANPGMHDAAITLNLRSSDSQINTTRTITVPAKQSNARLLNEIFPELVGVSCSGPIKLQSDWPVAALAIVGSWNDASIANFPFEPAP